MANMIKKVPLVSVGVSRDGKTVHPPIGKVFEFTQAEIAEMDALGKSTDKPQYRDLIVEADPAAEAKAKAKADADAKAKADADAKAKADADAKAKADADAKAKANGNNDL